MRINYKKVIFISAIVVAVIFVSYKTSYVQCTSTEFFKKDLVTHKDNIMPVVIIGSGPAGLSAALYTSREGYPTLVIEGPLPGGQLTQTSYVENWPGIPKTLGPVLMEDFKKYIKDNFNVQFLQDRVEHVDTAHWPFTIKTVDGATIHAFAIIIATGSTPKKLSVDGEKEYWGKGVTTCATCDAPFYKGKKVVVVGGGDSAAEEALQLSSHAASVEILVRKDKMRASKIMQEHVAKTPNIKILYNKAIKKIMGDEHHVNAIELTDFSTNTTDKKPIDGVFLAIGHEPNTKLFKGVVNMTDAGYIIPVGRSQRTSVKGIFSAGDVDDNMYRQAGNASAEGLKAAIDARMFFQDIGIDADYIKRIEDQLYEPGTLVNVEVPEIKGKAELTTIVTKNKVVVVDFYGTHCPPCKRMLPIFDELAARLGAAITFVKANTAQNEELVQEYKIVKIPCFAVFKNGKLVDTKYGAMEKKAMADWLKSFTK